jgi:carboxyl-terminal processing protease
MKPLKIGLVVLAAIIMVAGAFSGGVIVGWLIPENSVFGQNSSENLTAGLPGSSGGMASETEELFAPFWETWEIVHDQYVDQPVDDTDMMRGAISGMLESLGDPHTSYMDPDEFRQSNMPLEGEYEGIGAWVDTSGDYVKIISPMPNSPAEKAGLQPEDAIIAIDGVEMDGIDPDIALRSVLGPAGTEVVLTILRDSVSEPFDVTIVRDKITIPSVLGQMLEEDIAYIELATFGERSQQELRDALKPLLEQNPKGLILDLRYNGGGYLDTAIEVTSEFISGNQVVLYEEFSDGSLQEYKSLRGGLVTDIPLVILVNDGTASASEITAGAIQDYERGVLVGTTTYGKGSVQNWIPLSGDEGAVRVTISRWLTPSQRQINEVGLTPDYIVELTEEDYENNHDAQLEKAIEILTEN